MKPIALRDSFGQALVELGKAHENLVVLTADLAAATKTKLFADQFPNRHFNCGIAEGNMHTLAAGMATEGYVPFVSTFAMFSAGRAYEQIRNSIGYPHLNVKIAATHGGLSVGEDGASHQCNEDFALMRAIPGMAVLCPCDDAEARACVVAAYEHDGPVYLRFSRAAPPTVHKAPLSIQIGRGEVLRPGTDVALVANGLMVSRALEAAELLSAQGISARVMNLCTIKPLDETLLLQAAEECGRIVTCEEHSVIGGLGEAVAAFLSEHHPVPLRRIGVQDCFGASGSVDELFQAYHLTAADIAEAAQSLS